MAASVQYRPQDRSLGMVMREVDEDLAIFLEIRRHEKENSDHNLIEKSNDYHDSVASNLEISVVSDPMSTAIAHETSAAENSLDSEKEQKSDYDWLVSQPGTSSFPSLEMEVQGTAASQTEIANGLTIDPKAEPENPPDESSSLNDTSRQPSTSAGANSCAPRIRRPFSAGGQKSTAPRFPTPTRGSALPEKSKPFRSSTATNRGAVPSSKPMAPLVRSSTPSRIAARSSTPPARSSTLSTSKSISRSATPTCKPSSPSITPCNSAPSSHSSSVNKTNPMMAKNPGISRGTSPTVRSRPKKPAEVPISSSDPPPLKVIVPKRPSSATRGRPIVSSMKSSSTDATVVNPRQNSCSPMRQRVNASAYNASNVLSRSRGYSNGSDYVNPVLMGTKMVERVVNMRKLAPPKQDNQPPSNDNSTKKSSSIQENSGFGRSLSKKSLDMAIRHMDIRSINGNLNTIVKSVPASSVYTLRSGSMKTRILSASNSPHATSSSASSAPSANNSSATFYSSDMEINDIGSERESSSPTSQLNEKSGELIAM